MAVSYDKVDGYIVLVDFYFIHKLKIVAYANGESFRGFEQPVIIPFSAADTISTAVVSHSRDNYHVNVVDTNNIISIGFLDSEGTQM